MQIQIYCNKKPYLPQSHNGKFRTTKTTIYHSSLRSSEPLFHFTGYCLFCSKPTCLSGNERSVDAFPVRTSKSPVTTFSGCDTTSRLYGIGKRAALRKLTYNASFRNEVRVFTNESTLDGNTVAGKRVLCCFYVAQSAPTNG